MLLRHVRRRSFPTVFRRALRNPPLCLLGKSRVEFLCSFGVPPRMDAPSPKVVSPAILLITTFFLSFCRAKEPLRGFPKSTWQNLEDDLFPPLLPPIFQFLLDLRLSTDVISLPYPSCLLFPWESLLRARSSSLFLRTPLFSEYAPVKAVEPLIISHPPPLKKSSGRGLLSQLPLNHSGFFPSSRRPTIHLHASFGDGPCPVAQPFPVKTLSRYLPPYPHQ